MITKALDFIEEWLITFMMGGATLLIFLSVVHRYGSGFRIPYVQDWLISLNFSWAQELCIIMFVWMAKFGAAYGVRMGVHVGVDVLINRLPVDWRKLAVIISLACGIAFTAIIGTLGFRFVWEIGMHYAVFNVLGLSLDGLTSGPTTPDLDWPSWIVYSAVPYGSYLMCFRFVQVTLTYLRTGEMPRHDETKIEGIQAVEDDPEVAMPHGALAGARNAQLATAGGVN